MASYIIQEVWSVNARLYIAAFFPIFFYHKSFFIDIVPNTLPVQYIPRPYLFISTASLPPIQKPYSIQVLGLWTFVLEEFGYNVPNYINSLGTVALSN